MNLGLKFADSFSNRFAKNDVLTIEEYLELCKADHMAYANAAERMLKAIGEPRVVDTSEDGRLSRIFSNKKIRVYDVFNDFFGAEEPIERLVAYFRHFAQGLEESRGLCYLKGPVGGGKSSIVERLKDLMQVYPIYVLTDTSEKNPELRISPVFESPLGIFSSAEHGDVMESSFHIDRRYFNSVPSGWAQEKLREFNGDWTRFSVTKLFPNKNTQVGIMKVEPSDENNQDVSVLVGKTDIRKLETYPQNHPYSYSYSGGLNRTTQGFLEFAEMFKANIKTLNPLLTATQEHNYNGTENVPSMPYNGIICAHCFSDDTELLTKDGWKTHDQIVVGETELATMNLQTSQMEYQPALKKFEQNYSGPMYHFENDGFNHLVTPNHKMVYSTIYSSKWKTAEACELTAGEKRVPVSARWNVPDYPVSDDALRLMVWVVADGNLHGNTVRFRFAKKRKINRLSALLNRMGIEYKKHNDNDFTSIGNPITSISFKNDEGYSKSIPDYYNQLSGRQADIVIKEYSYTDGTRCNSKGETCHDDVLGEKGPVTYVQLSTSVKKHADILQHLAFVAGHKSNMCTGIKEHCSPQYFLAVQLNKAKHTLRSNHHHTENYTGTVFCFETPNHTLVARRKGKVVVTGNSNEAEWFKFRNDKTNEAFLDRIYIINVPYCLRSSEEQKIYEKMISHSSLKDSPMAPETLKSLSEFMVLTRLRDPDNSTIVAKMKVYDGQSVKDTMPLAKPLDEYKEEAGVDEGMTGLSTRFGFKIISQTFNLRPEEIQANPIDLMYVLENALKQEHLPADTYDEYINFIKSWVQPRYLEFIDKELRIAYLESYSDFGQNMFERYFTFAEAWLDDSSVRDPETHVMLDRTKLEAKLDAIEKPAQVVNSKDFRNDIVHYILRYKAQNNGNLPPWNAYERIKTVIEKKMFAATSEILPVISFGPKGSSDEQKKHDDFVARMRGKGYTDSQVKLVVDWWMSNRRQ